MSKNEYNLRSKVKEDKVSNNDDNSEFVITKKRRNKKPILDSDSDDCDDTKNKAEQENLNSLKDKETTNACTTEEDDGSKECEIQASKENLCKDFITFKEDLQVLRKSPSMVLDEDFDIDKFFGNSNQEQSNNFSISNTQPTKQVEEISTNLNDDEFLNLFPEINFTDNIKTQKPNAKSKKKEGPTNIAEYAIQNNENENLNCTKSEKDYDTPPSTSKEFSNNYGSCVMREIQNVNSNSLKRHLFTSMDCDNDLHFKDSKKLKTDKYVYENDTNEAEINSLNLIKTNYKFNESFKKEIKEKKYDNEDMFNSEDEDDDDNEYDDENTLNEYMPFPNALSEINFDISAIPRGPAGRYSVTNLGDKGLQTYLYEASVAKECIEHLYHCLTKAPTDGIEKDPKGLRITLMPHQRQALKWMKWREEQKPAGGILADDMGLGKTVQMIALIVAAKNEKQAKDHAEGKNDDSDYDSDNDWNVSSPRKIHNGRTLVICPASLITQWEREAITKCHFGKIRVYVFHGSNKLISEKRLSQFDIVITSYGTITQEYELHVVPYINKNSKIFKINWDRIILDEAHYIRNYQTKNSKAICELSAKNRWALTGTPIQNKANDLYALIKFLKCSPFDEIKIWNKWVSNKKSAGNQRLIVITKALMLRRTKVELIGKGLVQALPDKKLDIIEITLDPEEKLAYQNLLMYSQSFFHEFLRQQKEKDDIKKYGYVPRRTILQQEVPTKLSKLLKALMRNHPQIKVDFILVLILRLRQICCHPSLIRSFLDKTDVELEGNGIQSHLVSDEIMEELNKFVLDEDSDEEEEDVDESVAKEIMLQGNPIYSERRCSSKVRAVLETIQSILNKGEKVIVVSQWTSFLDIIANRLNMMEDVYYERFTGKVLLKNRQKIVDKLNDSEDKLNVLLLSLTAGGVGLNLVGANNLLLVDLHWNPQLEIQAQDRIYRFGQLNNVHVYKFICKDTIETNIQKLQNMKLEIAKNVLTGAVSNKLTLEDLHLLFS